MAAHSLGGVMAQIFSKGKTDLVKGQILMGSVSVEHHGNMEAPVTGLPPLASTVEAKVARLTVACNIRAVGITVISWTGQTLVHRLATDDVQSAAGANFTWVWMPSAVLWKLWQRRWNDGKPIALGLVSVWMRIA